MTLGERLKEIRAISGLSIEDVAKRAKISRKQLTAYENGKIKPRLKTVNTLANVYGILPKDITDLDSHAPNKEGRQAHPINDELRKAYNRVIQLGYCISINNNVVSIREVKHPENVAKVNKNEFEKWLLDVVAKWEKDIENYLENCNKQKLHDNKVALQEGEKELFQYCGVDNNE